MASRTNIRSRLNAPKEIQASGRERLNWRIASINRGEEITNTANTQRSFRQPTSNFHIDDQSDLIPTTRHIISNTTAEDFDYTQHNTKPRIDSLGLLNTSNKVNHTGWRGTFNIPTDLPSTGELLDSPQSPTLSEDTFDNSTPPALYSIYGIEGDAMSQEHAANDKKSIFESHRFQSLRSRKQRDLDLLSQRYKQNQEDWNKLVNDATNFNDHAPNGDNANDGNRRPNGINHTHNLDETLPTNYNNDKPTVMNKKRHEDVLLKHRNNNNDFEIFSFANRPNTAARASVDIQTPVENVYTAREYRDRLLSDSSSYRETHFDSVDAVDNRTSTSGDASSNTVSPRSSFDQQWSPEIRNQSGNDEEEISFSNSGKTQTKGRDYVNNQRNNYPSHSYEQSYNEIENSTMDESFVRQSSKRSSRQQIGLRDAVQGLFARIGRKVGRNEIPKLSKDDRILAIMLERKEREEREELEREEAHARWEAERLELSRNSACRRTIDPSSFRRRDSLGGSTDRSGRESSKARVINPEKQAERRKYEKIVQEEQKQQLQMKIENDFQRVNSLRASMSQQNLLKSKLKNLQMEQKQQQISLLRRKSMENLTHLKKHIETKQTMAEQNLENMKKDARKSRDDLRSKSEQSRLRLQLLNDEMAQYQAELKEFNEKQLQHADYLLKRVHAERKETAKRERMEKERMLHENRRRIHEEEEKRSAEKGEVMMLKERRREQLVKEKSESLARSKAAARASQLLREEIRNSDDLALTARKLAALHERSFVSSKRSSDTESLASAATSPTYHMTPQRTNM